jgi:hypothetical protein
MLPVFEIPLLVGCKRHSEMMADAFAERSRRTKGKEHGSGALRGSMRNLSRKVSVREATERDCAHESNEAIGIPRKGRDEGFGEGTLAVMIDPKLCQHGLAGLPHCVK